MQTTEIMTSPTGIHSFPAVGSARSSQDMPSLEGKSVAEIFDLIRRYLREQRIDVAVEIGRSVGLSAEATIAMGSDEASSYRKQAAIYDSQRSQAIVQAVMGGLSAVASAVGGAIGTFQIGRGALQSAKLEKMKADLDAGAHAGGPAPTPLATRTDVLNYLRSGSKHPITAAPGTSIDELKRVIDQLSKELQPQGFASNARQMIALTQSLTDLGHAPSDIKAAVDQSGLKREKGQFDAEKTLDKQVHDTQNGITTTSRSRARVLDQDIDKLFEKTSSWIDAMTRV